MNISFYDPEYCPSTDCRYHDRIRATNENWYIFFGTFATKARGRVQRFRCKGCGKTFSTQTFSLNYWTHSDNDYCFVDL